MRDTAGLDNSGAELVAGALQNHCAIALLDLAANPITDAGAAALLRAIDSAKTGSVERLDLGSTDITDACVDHLQALVSGGCLRALGLSLTSLSASVLHGLCAGSGQRVDNGEADSDSSRRCFVDIRGTALALGSPFALPPELEPGLDAVTIAQSGLCARHPLCDHRVGVFRVWLLETFGLAMLRERGVVDTAGGRGLLGLTLGMDGVPACVVDPRAPHGGMHVP
jgi:hypothetical protein